MKLTAFREKLRADNADRRLEGFVKRIKNFADEFQNVTAPKCTGWFVMLKKSESESGYDFVGIFNPDISNEEIEPEWDLVLPIPNFDDTPEFQGW